MISNYRMIEGFRVWEDDYDDYKGKYELTGVHAAGMCLLFAKWLRENGLSDDTADDVYDNTSGLRDGNRLDIMDNYNLTEDGRYQISYIWGMKYGIVYASVYDDVEGKYVGNIEISC